MSREIKFRGKRTDNGQWVHGDLIRLDDYTLIADLGMSAGPFNGSSVEIEAVAVDPKTVGEFAGFMDKDGKQVYEGDILGTVLEDIVDPSGECTVCNQITFQDGSFGWIGEVTASFLDWHTDPIKRGKVVGNIHDNPDLL